MKNSQTSAEEGKRLLASAKRGDSQAFAKFLSWIERAELHQIGELGELFSPSRAAFRLGVTGPPGAGKSTLVGQLLTRLSSAQLKIGVLAVDPSSPFTHGAILGDRIRYSEHVLKQNIFIRSLGTRGSLGGLSSAAFLMARAFDLCEFDVLLIETVGVGQTELDVLHVADQVCVVLVPESGDSIQAMKAGLMEIADLFVVNKADRPGADGLAREIEASLHDGENSKPARVLKCVASEGRGVDELASVIEKMRLSGQALSHRTHPARLREEARALLRRALEAQISAQVAPVQSAQDLTQLLLQATSTITKV